MDDDLKKATRGGEDTKHPESGIEREPRPPDAIPEVEDRSELARYLEPSAFPARGDALLECAQRHHAPDYVLDKLRGLPDQQYDNVEQVWEAIAASGSAGQSSGR